MYACTPGTPEGAHMHLAHPSNSCECPPDTTLSRLGPSPEDTLAVMGPSVVFRLLQASGILPGPEEPKELGFSVEMFKFMVTNARQYISGNQEVKALARVINCIMSPRLMEGLQLTGSTLCLWGLDEVVIKKDQLGEERWECVVACARELSRLGGFVKETDRRWSPVEWSGLVPELVEALKSTEVKTLLAKSLETTMNEWVANDQVEETQRLQLSLACSMVRCDQVDTRAARDW